MTAPSTIRPSATVSSPLRQRVARHPVGAFLLAVFAVNLALALVPVLTRRDLLPFGLALYDSLGPLFGVALPAFAVVAMTGGRSAAGDLARRCLRGRVRLRWHLFAFLSVPLGTLLGSAMVFRQPLLAVLGERWAQLFTTVLPRLVLLALFCIVAEEVGFLGFLQARWQDRFGPLPASLLVTIPFAVYHLPGLMVEFGFGLRQLHLALAFLAVLAVLQMFGRIVLTWLYNATGASVLMGGLWHSSFDATTTAFSHTFAVPGPAANGELAGFWLPSAVVVVLAGIVIVRTRGRLCYRPHNPGRTRP